MLELKNIQAIIYRDGIPVGGVKIDSDGTPKCDWNALNQLTPEQKKELDKIVRKFTEFLETCAVVKEEFRADKDVKTGNYKITRKIGKQEAEVGIIRRDNKELFFTAKINVGAIQLCLDQLDAQHATDFYYGGRHYNGN